MERIETRNTGRNSKKDLKSNSLCLNESHYCYQLKEYFKKIVILKNNEIDFNTGKCYN